MPSIDYETSIEIEVYCDTCGAGLCNQTNSTTGRRRQVRQFRVEVCGDCMDKKDGEIEDLEKKIKELEERIEELESVIDKLKSQ